MKILVVKTDFIERRFGCTNDYISIISKFSLRIQFAKFSLRMIWVFKVGILLSIFMELKASAGIFFLNRRRRRPLSGVIVCWTLRRLWKH